MNTITEIHQLPDNLTKQPIPLFLNPVQAGFPSPAEDYVEATLDLNEYLIDRPAATYFVRVAGESMINAGINAGDILIVDRSKSPKNGEIVVAQIDNDFTVKRYHQGKHGVVLSPENDAFKPIVISDGQLVTMGVVTGVVRRFKA